MIRAMMTAASGMKAQQMQVDTIANNIANANTAGFKKSELSFRSLLYQTYREPGASTSTSQRNPIGLQVGSGTEIAGSAKIFEQGILEPSSNPLALALEGDGFFSVKTPSGEVRYTRDGNFHRDQAGAIVTAEGYFLDPQITLPTDALTVTVGEDGTISATTTEGGAETQVGTISLFRFPNASGLKAQGGNYYSISNASGAPVNATAGLAGAGTIKQGYSERANIEVVEELVGLILAQRNYEVNSRAIKVSDEMMQQVNQLVR